MASASSPILDGEPVEPTVVEAFVARRYRVAALVRWGALALIFVSFGCISYLAFRTNRGHESSVLETMRWLRWGAPLGAISLFLSGYYRYSAMRNVLQFSGASCRLLGQHLVVTRGSTTKFRLTKRDIASLKTPTIPSAHAKVIERGAE